MSSAESSFRESLRAFNSRSGSREDQESLLGSFQTRASTAIASVWPASSSDTEFCGLTMFQRYLGFGILMGTACLCFMISFFTLPMVLITPYKFALTWTVGSFLFLFSFALIKGLMAHAKHIFSLERLPFTLAYLGSMCGSIYFSVISASYIGVIAFSMLQLITLAWYVGSYLPGGTNGLRMMTRSVGLPV